MKTKSLLSILFICVYNLVCQNPTEKSLHEKYWVFRDKFRKFYTEIGKEPGKSLTIDRIHPMKRCHNVGGMINYGDVMAFMGEYLGVLSTELYLLNQSETRDFVSIKATEIELYYAINAIQRCDEFAEEYYGQTSVLNGFFVRCDVPQGFYRRWELLGDQIRVQHSDCAAGRQIDYSRTSGNNFFAHDGQPIFFNLETYDECLMKGYSETSTGPIIGHGGTVNEMSIDQLIGVLFGFKNIMKFVSPNLVVDPDGMTGTLPSKNIHEWVKQLTHHCMIYITNEKKNAKIFDAEYVKEHPGQGKLNFNIFREGNYILTNPTNSDDNTYHVERGPYAFPFGYALEKLGEDITGNDYAGVSMKLSVGMQAFRYAMDALTIYGVYNVVNAYSQAYAMNLAQQLLPNGDALVFVANPNLKWFIGAALSPDAWSLSLLGMPCMPSNPTWWEKFYNFIPKNGFIMDRIATGEGAGAGMFIWLPSASNTWEHEDFNYLMDLYDKEWCDLIYGVLNESRPMINPESYQNWLSQAACDGTRNETDQYVHQPFNVMSIFSGGKKDYFDDGLAWNGSNEPSLGNRNWYNGLDYMLLYNYYRIASVKYFPKLHEGVSNHYWNTANSFNDYRDIKCPCKSSDRFYTDNNLDGTHLSELSTLKTDIPFRFPDYKPMYIRIPEWLTQNYNINSGGELRPQGDLSICNSTTTINSGGKLSTSENSDPSFYKIITVGKNAILEIMSNGILEVSNNTMILVEEGGKLKYNQGAKIILNGSNSVLKVEQGGQIVLNTGAVFQIESGDDGLGYVHFHSDWRSNLDPPGITCVDNTAKFIISGIHNDKGSYYNDKKLQITGNIGLVTDWKLKQLIVEKCFVAMGKGSRIVSNAEFTKFSKCVVNVLSNSNQDLFNQHNGIRIPGRLNSFDEVEINNCYVGISFYNRGGQEILKVNNSVIRNAIIGIDQLGGGQKLENSQISGFKNAVNVNGGLGFTRLRGNMFTIDIPAGFRPGSSSYRYFGSGTLYAWNNWFKKAAFGLQIFDAKLRLKCNLFNENRINLAWNRAPYVSMFEGYNQFASYSGSHIKGRGDTYFTLKDGYNIFEDPNNTFNQYLFDVMMSDRSPWSPYIFDGGNNGYINLSLKNYVDPDQNYQFQLYDFSSSPIDLSLFTNPNLSSTIFNTKAQNCTAEQEFKTFNYHDVLYTNTENDQGGSIATQLFSTPTRPINPTIVKTSQTQDEALGMVIRNNYDRLYNNETNRIDTLLREVSNVLRLNSNRLDLNDSSNAKDLKIAYELYNSAFSFLAFKESSDSSENIFDKTSEYYAVADSTFQGLWNQSKDTNSIWSKDKYQILVDWAQINRLSNNKSKSLNILDSGILFFEDSFHLNGINMWKCVIELEIALQNDTNLSIDSAISSCNCYHLLTINSDTFEVPESDSVVHFCNWEKTKLAKASSYIWKDASTNLQSIEKLGQVNLNIELNVNDSYTLKEGTYRLIYSDSSLNAFRVLNLIVIGDTPTIVEMDSIKHVCDWRSHNIIKKVVYYPTHSGFSYISHNIESNIKISDYKYDIGEYQIDEFDTTSCIIYRTNLSVIGDSVELVTIRDTTISTCIIDTFFNRISTVLDFGDLPFDISRNESDTVTIDSFSMSVRLNVDVLDTNNCKIERTILNYIAYFPTKTYEDSTIVICSSIDSLESCIVYHHPSNNPTFVQKIVFNDSTSQYDSIAYFDSCLIGGHYFIQTFDKTNCNLTYTDLLIFDTLVCETSEFLIFSNNNFIRWRPKQNDEFKNKKLASESKSNDNSKNFVRLFPNPADGFLTIESSNNFIQAVRIYNMQGMCVKELNIDIEALNLSLSTQEFSSGNYIIQIVTTNDIYIHPLVLVH